MPASFEQNRLLATLSVGDEEAFFGHLKPFSAELGYVLQEPGQTLEHVYFPLYGMISLVASMKNGGLVETAVIGKEGAHGMIAALSNRPPLTRSVVQLSIKALRMATAPFLRCCEDSKGVRHMVNIGNDSFIAQVLQTAACNAAHAAESRLASWLLRSHDRGSGGIINLTQEYMAQMLGVRRTTVTMIAQELQALKLIRYTRGHLEIVDRRGLAKVACECYEVISSREMH
jgi:CRP-like cAMP-binding protein